MQLHDILTQLDLPPTEYAWSTASQWIQERFKPDVIGGQYTYDYAMSIIRDYKMVHGIRERLSHLAKMYQAFLKSPRWQEVRRKVLIRDGHTCRWCGCQDVDALHVHHLTYARGWDSVEDCITLCRDCHQGAHENRRTR